jgi:deoxycytidine triphosphate deaminase
MILNDSTIESLCQSQQLLSDYAPENINNCTYVLRMGSVFRPEAGAEELLTRDGGYQRHFWEIGPSETLVVMTKEAVCMPPELCGTYSPLFRLAKQGVLLLNASIIEPGYAGPLSCFLVNFSAARIILRDGDPIAKLIFHRLENPPGNLKALTIGTSEYKKILCECAGDFHRSFMNVAGIVSQASDSAKEQVKRSLTFGGIFVAVLLLWASLEPLLSNKLWQHFGIMDASHRVEDAKLQKDLESAQLTLRGLIEQQRTDDTTRRRLSDIEAQLVQLKEARGK